MNSFQNSLSVNYTANKAIFVVNTIDNKARNPLWWFKPNKNNRVKFYYSEKIIE